MRALVVGDRWRALAAWLAVAVAFAVALRLIQPNRAVYPADIAIFWVGVAGLLAAVFETVRSGPGSARLRTPSLSPACWRHTRCETGHGCRP